VLIKNLAQLNKIQSRHSIAIFRPAMFSLSELYLLLILFFYIPANNQIFQYGELTVEFLFFWDLFVLKKSKKNIKNKLIKKVSRKL
jgi:hypothetical protein